MKLGKRPRPIPVNHRSFADAIDNAERQKRLTKGIITRCRLHDRPWTECAECSPSLRKKAAP